MKTKIYSLMLIIAASIYIASCSKDEDDKLRSNPEEERVTKPTLDKTSITLYVDGTETLTYSGKDCSWSSENTYIASVKNGVVTGEHVGTTTIYANDLTCTVTVKPRYTSIYEPYIKWGAIRSDITKYMDGYSLRSTSTATMLAYEGKGSVMGYAYSLQNGELYASAFSTYLSYVSYLTDWLFERYVLLEYDKENYSVYMATPDLQTFVLYYISTSGLMVAYAQNPQYTTKAASSSDRISLYSIIQNVMEECYFNETSEIPDSIFDEIILYLNNKSY